jgi:hypothetical protein
MDREGTLTTAIGVAERVRAACGIVRVLATGVFALLFVAGPVLTFLLGPDTAVLYVAALLYPTVAVAIASLWWKRADFHLGAAQCAWLSVEILVCPPFGANLIRKITARHHLDADAAQILVATASRDTTEAVLATLARRAEELIAETDAEGVDRDDDLRAYLTTIRAGQ